MLPPPPRSTLFPYTTLFRSRKWIDYFGRVNPTASGDDLTASNPARAMIESGRAVIGTPDDANRSEEHTSELQSQSNLVCRLLLEKKKKKRIPTTGEPIGPSP